MRPKGRREEGHGMVCKSSCSIPRFHGRSRHLWGRGRDVEAFTKLITNPFWAKLCGPCPQCEDYFLRKTDRKRVYCSQRCSSRHTAISATAERRLQTSQEKILKAQHEIDEWKKARPKSNWKIWVAARTSRSRISLTVHWLSRAVNAGLICPP